MEINEASRAFAALSQETRLELICLLTAQGPNGLPAGELSALLGVPASTLSFHLAALERADLTQSTRQGRQIVHAARFNELRRLLTFLTEACCGGRPDLYGIPANRPAESKDPGMTPAFNVLFLCTHNAARSIMAEALLRSLGNGRFNAYSAGSDPNPAPNPDVIAKLRAFGHETDGLHSKNWLVFTGRNAPRMDFVITLCDMLEGDTCPDFGGLAVTAAWPLPDPAQFHGSAVERTSLLNELYASLRRRIEIFTSLPFASLDRIALKTRLDALATAGFPAPVERH